jgi:prolyl-tRNA synthetase
VVIVPIYKNKEQYDTVCSKARMIEESLKNRGIAVKLDDRDTYKPGWKFNEYEFKGVPVRIAIGPRDVENGTVEIARRDTLEKQVYQLADLENKVVHLLDAIQDNMFQKALSFREDNTRKADTWDEFRDILENKGGFVLAHWDGTAETEQKIKEETKATIRCIPLEAAAEAGKCVYSGQPSSQRVVFALAY